MLAESEVQFGQYRGKTFRWLLENDVGYACSIIASHRRERESGDPSQTPLMMQKDSLTSYAMPFVFRLTAQAVNWEAFLCSLMSLPSSRALRSFSCPGPSTSRRWWEIPELHWHRQLNLALLVVMEKGLTRPLQWSIIHHSLSVSVSV